MYNLMETIPNLDDFVKDNKLQFTIGDVIISKPNNDVTEYVNQILNPLQFDNVFTDEEDEIIRINACFNKDEVDIIKDEIEKDKKLSDNDKQTIYQYLNDRQIDDDIGHVIDIILDDDDII